MWPPTPIWIVLYMLCSSSMLVINKASLNVFPFPLFLSTIQTTSSAILIIVSRGIGRVQFAEVTVQKLWAWRSIALAFILPVMLNMKTVQVVGVETAMVFRAISTVAVAFGEYWCLGVSITRRQVVACALISFGGLLYAFHDVESSFLGYFWGTLYCLSIVVNNVFIKHAFNCHAEMTPWEKTFYNNLVSSPMLLAFAAVYEDTARVSVESLRLSMDAKLLLGLSCVAGLGSN
jgi:drug/metabolite transporter (DMT)-like permease